MRSSCCIRCLPAVPVGILGAHADAEQLAGMLSLQTLVLILLTLSDDVALSIVGPFAVYFTDAAVGGVTYPLDLMVGGFEPDSGRALWKARMASEWKAIAEEFGVTDVLTYPDWELRLPVVARSGSFTSNSAMKWCARRESNPMRTGSKPGALS